MKYLLLLLAIIFVSALVHAQQGNTLTIRYAGVPTGTCGPFFLAVNNATSDEYNCTAGGAWNKIGSAGTCPQGTCVVNAPTLDQVISGAHALILSDVGSNFYVGSSNPFGGFGNSGQVAFGPGEAALDPFYQGGPFRSVVETTGAFTAPGSATVNGIFSKTQYTAGNNSDLIGVFGASLFIPTVNDTTNGLVIAVEGDASAKPGTGQTFGSVVGGFFDAANLGVGTVVDLISGDFEPEPGLNVGPVTNSTGILIDNFSNIGTNNYALHILNQATASATTYAIKVEGGKSDLGPQVTTVGNLIDSGVGASLPLCTDSGKQLATSGCGIALLASPTFTGTPAAPTATVGTNTTQLATTAFVLANQGSGAVSSVFTRTGAVVAVSGDYSLDKIAAAAASTTYADGDNPILFNSAATTAGRIPFTFGETTASTSTGTPYNVEIKTLIGSTATPLKVDNSLNGSQALPTVSLLPTWNTSGAPTALLVNPTNTASAATSLLLDLQASNASKFKVGVAGAVTGTGWNIDASGNFSSTGGSVTAAVNIGYTSAMRNQTFNTFLTSPASAVTQLGAAAAASPVAQTLQSQGSRGGTDTDVAGGNFTIQSGTGTGAATPALLNLSGALKGASGTTAQTQVIRQAINDTKALSTTTATTTTILSLNVAADKGAGVVVRYTILAHDTTGHHNCTVAGLVTAVAENSAGTIVAGVDNAAGHGSVSKCDGANTMAPVFAITNANPAVLSIAPTWTGITPTSVTLVYNYDDLAEASATQ